MPHAAVVYLFVKTCYANLRMKIPAPRLNSSPLAVRLTLTAFAVGATLACETAALHAQSSGNELLKGRAAMGAWTPHPPALPPPIPLHDLPLPTPTPSN